MDRIRLLGVPIDVVTAQTSVERLLQMLSLPKGHHVMTPNAEMLVAAARDNGFRELLNATDLNLPDSGGMVWMAKWTGQHLPERVTGIDTVERLCARLTPEQPIFLLGGKPGVAEKAALILRSRNPNLRIAGTFAGSPKEEDAGDIINRINTAKPHILLVAYGAPKQDQWIHAHLPKLPTVRIAMGVGGTFDFLAGTQKRAPVWMQRMYLEWLWRLLLQPSRWRRIATAVLVFPWLVVRYGKEAPGARS
jgi:N-acetylglucosaminyldiphosphoundecaprenol N-acetyl-beta-D-mannosaminyltransferase